MGKSSNTRTLLIFGLIVLGIYVLPTAVAKFAGSHTWEFNRTGGVTSIECGKCHTYIKNEINSSDTVDVMWAHLNASANSSYVGPGLTININNSPSGSLDDVCWMCHVVQNEFATLGGTHTKVVIRVCTDTDCHGNETGPYPIFGEAIRNVTGRLNNDADAHYNFYRPLTAWTSAIGQENTSLPNYDQGYISCLTCHTHVGLDLNLTRPQKLSLWMTLISVQTGWNATNLTVNMTNTSSVIGGKEPGSLW
jgi:hypothetical protein